MHIPLLPVITAAPSIDLNRVPAEGHEEARHVATLLASLARYERDFRLAVLLFEWAHAATGELADNVSTGKLDFGSLDRATDTLSGWMSIAARDAALSIYHFGKTVSALNQSTKEGTMISAQIKTEKLTEGSKIFWKSFPGHEAIRDVVGHAAEFSSTREQKEKHAFTGSRTFQFGGVGIGIGDEDAVTQWSGNLYDRTYCVSFKGRVYSYEITDATATILTASKLKIYSAFDKLCLSEN